MQNKRELYLIRLGHTEHYKIGISKNSQKRVKQLQTGCPYQLHIIYVIKPQNAFKLETILHNEFKHKKASPKFDINFDFLQGEWFTLTSEDVLNFKETCQTIESRIQHLKDVGNPFV